ncbi:MAG TPA: M50 family metallopeptidase [Caulobacteraceae bacterium]|jgi:regulator of sigma E protease|nr:M50 family metallopeptidase [Caulobacteraceae bacterium]
MIASVLYNAAIVVLPFLFVLTLVVTVHELGHFLVARWLGVAVDRFAIGFGRSLVKWTDRSGVEWRVGWIPLGGYVRFAGDAEASSTVPDGDDLQRLRGEIVAREGVGAERKYFHFKPVWVRALVVAAGPVANFILSITLFAVLLAAIGETVHRPRVSEVEPGSPAAAAGFLPGDVVTAIDGRRIDDFMELRQFVTLRAGLPIRFGVDREGRSLELTATPERRVQVDGLTGASAKLGVLGLKSSARPEDVYRKHYGPIQAVAGGVKRTWDILDTTVFYLGRLVRGLESGDQLGGPLRIAATSTAAAKAGAFGAADLGGKLLGGGVALLGLAAVLSVGIGFMNLLPVPVLDGGHLLFYAWEAVARRPLGARIQAAGYRVGLALLLGLMLFATWNDLQQLSVFKHGFFGLFS